MVGVSSRTSCRQLFKELSILTLASLYIFKVTCFIRKYCQSLEQILRFINIIHEESWLSMLNCKKNEIYKKSVINMGTKVYKKLPQFLKEIDDYKAFKKELKLFLLLQTFYSVEEFVSSQRFTSDVYLTFNYTKFQQYFYQSPTFQHILIHLN